MRRPIARALLHRWSREWSYDTGYLEHVLDVAPRTFFRFSKLFSLSKHAEVVPPDVLGVARLVATLHEDCGPCVQLMVDQALALGAPPEELAQVVRGERGALRDEARIAADFSHALVVKDGERLSAIRDEAKKR